MRLCGKIFFSILAVELATSFLLGLVQPALPVNLHKMVREWFPTRQLGLATGIVSAGFGTGLMLGSLLSATVFSPALGGWQRVLYLYGIMAVVISGMWFIVHPGEVGAAGRSGAGRRHGPWFCIYAA